MSTPWSEVGISVHGAMTAEEAIQRAGLDWEITLRTLYFAGSDGRPREIHGRYATVRPDTDEQFGIVGGDYQTLPNRDAFAFTTPLATLGAAYDSAGQYNEGRQVFLTMRLTQQTVLDEDPHDLYLFLQTSHDASKAVEIVVTPIRRRCSNQDSLILATAKNRWRVRHNTTMHDRLAEAQDTLKQTYKYVEAFEETAQRLMAIEVEHDQFRKMLESTLAPAVRQHKQVAEILALRESSPLLDDIRPTAWGALQAFTEWTDHRRPYRTPSTKLKAVTDGWVAQGRSHLAQQLLGRKR